MIDIGQVHLAKLKIREKILNFLNTFLWTQQFFQLPHSNFAMTSIQKLSKGICANFLGYLSKKYHLVIWPDLFYLICWSAHLTIQQIFCWKFEFLKNLILLEILKFYATLFWSIVNWSFWQMIDYPELKYY